MYHRIMQNGIILLNGRQKINAVLSACTDTMPWYPLLPRLLIHLRYNRKKLQASSEEGHDTGLNISLDFIIIMNLMAIP